MDSLKQVIEGELPIDRDRDLAVQNESRRGQAPKHFDQLRKVSRERLPRLRLEIDRIVVAKDEAAKSVPLGLILPAPAIRHLFDRLGLHRRKRRRDRKSQMNASSANRPVPERRGCQRSPSLRTRAGTLSIRKSSIETPFSTSFQVTGVETVARGVGRT